MQLRADLLSKKKTAILKEFMHSKDVAHDVVDGLNHLSCAAG